MTLPWILIVVDKKFLVRRDILFVFCGIWFLFVLGGYLQGWLLGVFFGINLIFLSVFFCVITLFAFDLDVFIGVFWFSSFLIFLLVRFVLSWMSMFWFKVLFSMFVCFIFCGVGLFIKILSLEFRVFPARWGLTAVVF